MSLGVDGELSRFEHSRLRRHLRRCASCRAFHAELSVVTGALRASPLETPEAPIELLPRRQRAAGVRPFLAVAAVAVAVLGLSGGLGGGLRSEPSSTDLAQRLLAYYQLDLAQPASPTVRYYPGSTSDLALIGGPGL